MTTVSSTTGLTGLSLRVDTFEILSATSCPSTTSPKMVCLPGQPFRRCHRDKKLRAVRVRPCIRHRQLALLVEPVRRPLRLILKLVPRSAHPRARRIAPLDHEVRNHPMKYRSVVEFVLALVPAHRMRPFPRPFGQFHKVGDGFRGLLLKKPANKLPFTRGENSIGSWLTGHKHSCVGFMKSSFAVAAALRAPTAEPAVPPE